MQMSDISLRPGDNFILVIDTDSYSGNFEREICGYATGIVDEERYHGTDQANAAMRDHPEMVKGIVAKQSWRTHAEYGQVSNTIRATPGRLNDGMGNHFDAETGQKGHPAYESVAIFLRSPLTREELEFVTARAHEFSQTTTFLRRETFRVLDVYQVNAVVTVTETKL